MKVYIISWTNHIDDSCNMDNDTRLLKGRKRCLDSHNSPIVFTSLKSAKNHIAWQVRRHNELHPYDKLELDDVWSKLSHRHSVYVWNDKDIILGNFDILIVETEK